jgi:hypothetical protein
MRKKGPRKQAQAQRICARRFPEIAHSAIAPPRASGADFGKTKKEQKNIFNKFNAIGILQI